MTALAYLALGLASVVVYKLVTRPAFDYDRVNDAEPGMMRAAPSMGAAVLAVIPLGARFTVLELSMTPGSNESGWVKIRAEEAQSGAAMLRDVVGWVYDA